MILGEYWHHLGTGYNFTFAKFFPEKERSGASGLSEPWQEDEAQQADSGGDEHPGQGDPHLGGEGELHQGDPHHGGDWQPLQGWRVNHPTLPDQDGQLKELKIGVIDILNLITQK